MAGWVGVWHHAAARADPHSLSSGQSQASATPPLQLHTLLKSPPHAMMYRARPLSLTIGPEGLFDGWRTTHLLIVTQAVPLPPSQTGTKPFPHLNCRLIA